MDLNQSADQDILLCDDLTIIVLKHFLLCFDLQTGLIRYVISREQDNLVYDDLKKRIIC